MAKQYPCIGSTGFRDKWAKKPENAPRCIVPACGKRATHRPHVEVNWFRGDDEACGPVCKEHSTDAKLLLLVTADWKAAQQKPVRASIGDTPAPQSKDGATCEGCQTPTYCGNGLGCAKERNAGVRVPAQDQGENHHG